MLKVDADQGHHHENHGLGRQLGPKTQGDAEIDDGVYKGVFDANGVQADQKGQPPREEHSDQCNQKRRKFKKMN